MPNSVRFHQPLPGIRHSQSLLERAKDLIPAQTQTLAKGPGQYSRGVCPAYVERAKGSHVWDVDGNEYIDFSMGVGPVSLGYCYPVVDEAIRKQLDAGITFSLMHPLEVEVAELIRHIVPHTECVRFSKTGADVTSAAIRLSRAFTGKNKVLCCGYHGWHDWYIGITSRNMGVPAAVKDFTHTFEYNNIHSVESALDDDTACVILEPMVFEEPRNNFLLDLRTLCSENGVVLIFDEMWTGFRLALGGAQEYFGVRADLCTFSKAIANGMPISVLSGRADIMKFCENDVFFFTTFGGETLSLAAAKATIEEMRDKAVPRELDKKGRWIQANLNTMFTMRNIPYLQCIGAPCRTMLSIGSTSLGNPLEIKTFFQQEFLKYGILWSGFHTLSFSHTDEDIDHLIRAYGDILSMLETISAHRGTVREYLVGETLEPVFRRTGNFHVKPKVPAGHK